MPSSIRYMFGSSLSHISSQLHVTSASRRHKAHMISSCLHEATPAKLPRLLSLSSAHLWNLTDMVQRMGPLCFVTQIRRDFDICFLCEICCFGRSSTFCLKRPSSRPWPWLLPTPIAFRFARPLLPSFAKPRYPAANTGRKINEYETKALFTLENAR